MAKTAAKTKGRQGSQGKAMGLSLHIGLNGVSGAAYGGWDRPARRVRVRRQRHDRHRQAAGHQADDPAHQEGDARAVLADMRKAAKLLVAGDLFFLSYSGHGGQVPDVNGDEDDKQGRDLVPLRRPADRRRALRRAGQVRPACASSCSPTAATAARSRAKRCCRRRRPDAAAEADARGGRDAHLPRAPGVLRQAAEGRRRAPPASPSSIPTPRWPSVAASGRLSAIVNKFNPR